MYKFVIDFIALNNIPFFNTIEFLGDKYQVQNGDTLIFERGEDFFKGEESKLVSIKLFTKKEVFDCAFFYFKDYNHCYCFLDELGNTYELLFLNSENINIKLNKYNSDINLYDTNKTKDRKRYLLVNYAFNSIFINDKSIHLTKYINNIYKSIEPSSSYQLSIYDLSSNYIIGRQIAIPLNLEGMKNVFNIHYRFFKQFYTDFAHTLKSEKMFKFRFNKLYHNYKNDDIPKYFLNRHKYGLDNDPYKELYIDFVYYMMLFIIYKEIMILVINYSTVKNFFNFLEIKFNQIKLDTNLQISEKIFIIEQFPNILKRVRTLDNFLKAGVMYYILSLNEKNSILDLIENYFFEYIKNLDDNDKIFFRLNEVESGIGYYNDKNFYSFGMMNSLELKNKLQKIFYNVLIVYRFKTKVYAIIKNKTNSITFYFYYVKDMDNYLLNKELRGYDLFIGKNIASKIIICLLHEAYGYKKFLMNKLDSIQNFSNYIESDIKLNAKDIRNFDKLMYSKIGDFSVMEIIEKINGYAEFLDNYEFWKNNFDDFNEYFTYKYLMDKINKQINEIPLNIKDKIQIVKSEIIKNGIDINSLLKKDSRLGGRKRKRSENINKNNNKNNNKKKYYYEDDDNDYEGDDEDDYLYEDEKHNIKENKKKYTDKNNDENDFKNMSYEELLNLAKNEELLGDDLVNFQMNLIKSHILNENLD